METRTESSELIARDDVAAIVLCGKLTQNGWLPRSGRVTRIVENLGNLGVAVGITPLGAGLPGSIASLCAKLT